MTEPSQRTAVSPIKIFRLIERKIQQIDTYPLTSDNLVIQQDAYKRLADDSIEYEFDVFASMEYARKESDADLRFMIQFAAYAFIFSIEGVGDLQIEYAAIGQQEKEIAEQIMAALIMLANGQLSCLHTLRRGKVNAVELIYREALQSPPSVLSVVGMYPRYVRNDDTEDYDTHIMRNAVDISPIKLPHNFFLSATKVDGSLLELKRPFEGNTLTPLTRTQYRAMMSEVANTLVGADDDREFNEKLNGSWVFALIVMAIVVPSVLLIPDSFFPYVGPLLGLLAVFVGGYITGMYLRHIENLRLINPGHPLIRLDAMLQPGHLLTIAHVALLGVMVASYTFPVYNAQSDHHLMSLLQLAQSSTYLVLLPGLILLLGIVSAFPNKAMWRIASGLLGFVSLVGIIIINFTLTYSGDGAVTPEPLTTIFLIVLLASIGLSIAMTASGIKAAKSSRLTTARTTS